MPKNIPMRVISSPNSFISSVGGVAKMGCFHKHAYGLRRGTDYRSLITDHCSLITDAEKHLLCPQALDSTQGSGRIPTIQAQAPTQEIC